MNFESFLPAYPLISTDPYLSVWSNTDHPADSDTMHWAGERKRITLTAQIDGVNFALIGRHPDSAKASLTRRTVTATKTQYGFEANGVKISVSFRAPLLLDDFDILSTPVTYVDIAFASGDGKTHKADACLIWHDDIVKDGPALQPMIGNAYKSGSLSLAWMGKKHQSLRCHSGDHITIDWGYAYIAADKNASFERVEGHWGLVLRDSKAVSENKETIRFMLAYDDVASIQYFEYTARAWYARNGKTIVQAIHEMHDRRDEIMARLDALDESLYQKALACGNEAYARLANASYRHTICAHKLIADREGNPIFLSKENDSNGCIGTVDVSYPSMPLYLIYAPELVRGMCRPILKFASLPIWKDDFAPHDVGRYPMATGQVYGLRGRRGSAKASAWVPEAVDPIGNGDVYPPLFVYDGEENLYDNRYQMPVEECGNMILMLAAAMKADGEKALIKEYLPTLKKWVRYLEEYGEDPGEQLCTDDFAGHLAHNVNLAFKAVSGLAAYGWIMGELGNSEEAVYYKNAAEKMAKNVYSRARTDNGTALTLDGKGWSLKYNAIWDQLFSFGLFDEEFYKAEIQRYKEEQNEYGVPLDSRRGYTKSDWILWAASMADSKEDIEAFSKPLVKYLKETPTRVPFSDWYETKTGAYCHFIARSVQGGIFMPMLKKEWGK